MDEGEEIIIDVFTSSTGEESYTMEVTPVEDTVMKWVLAQCTHTHACTHAHTQAHTRARTHTHTELCCVVCSCVMMQIGH